MAEHVAGRSVAQLPPMPTLSINGVPRRNSELLSTRSEPCGMVSGLDVGTPKSQVVGEQDACSPRAPLRLYEWRFDLMNTLPREQALKLVHALDQAEETLIETDAVAERFRSENANLEQMQRECDTRRKSLAVPSQRWWWAAWCLTVAVV